MRDRAYLREQRRRIQDTPPLPFALNREEWGDVVWWREKLPGVFHVQTTTAFRPRACRPAWFYAALKEGSALPAQALDYGEEQDGVCFLLTDEADLIVEYELLKAEGAAGELIRAVEELGKDICPGYFGTWPAPENTPWGPVDRCAEVERGVWLLHAGGQWLLSIAEILSSDLHEIPIGLGRQCPGEPEGPLFWQLDRAAPALYELIVLGGHGGLAPYIRSMAELEAHLCRAYPGYTAFYNALLEEDAAAARERGDEGYAALAEGEKIKCACPAAEGFLRLEALRALE